MMESSYKTNNKILFEEETPYGFLSNTKPCSKTQYGLKMIPIRDLKEEEKQNAEKEASLMKNLQHPNILPYVENYLTQDSQFLCLKTDLIGKGSKFFSLEL
jgi:hypothetical protein